MYQREGGGGSPPLQPLHNGDGEKGCCSSSSRQGLNAIKQDFPDKTVQTHAITCACMC